MDKNKNRTDMLAAGRKKLQQYRKKKDTKGSSSDGKSSKNTSKSQPDKVVDVPPAKTKSSEPYPTDKSEVVPPSDKDNESTDLSASNSGGNSVPIEVNLPEVEPSSSSRAEASGESELVVPVEIDVAQVSLSEPSSVIEVIGGETLSEIELAPADLRSSEATFLAVDRDKEQESMSAQEAVFDISSIHEKKGQEVDGSGSTQYDGRGENTHKSIQDSESLEVVSMRSEEGGNGESFSEESHDSKILEDSTHNQAEETHEREMDEGSIGGRAEATLGGEEAFEQAASTETTSKEEVTSVEKLESQQPDSGVDVFLEEDIGETSLPYSCESESRHRVQADTELRETADEVDRNPSLPQSADGVVSNREGQSSQENNEDFSGGQTISIRGETGTVNLYQLAEVLRGLEEEDLQFLFKMGLSFSSAGLRDTFTVPENVFADSNIQLNEQLYLSTVTEDFLHLQLAEQSKLQLEYDKHGKQLRSEVFDLHSLLEETKESNKSLSEELGLCRSELQVVSSGKEELEVQLLNSKLEIEAVSSRESELQRKLGSSIEDLANLTVQLENCKDLVKALQMENANLNENLILVTDEKNKLEERKDYIAHENEKLRAQLIEGEERLTTQNANLAKLEVDLRETMAHLEQLTEENIFLSSNLDIHKTKVGMLENENLELLSQAKDTRSQLEDTNTPIAVPSNLTSDEYSLQKTERCEGEVVSGLVEQSMTPSFTEGQTLQQIEMEDVDYFVNPFALKPQFEEAEQILQKLENAIEGMQSHSVSLSRSASKVPAPGVSKLIMAFESKVHHEENGPEELPLTEEQPTGDSFKLAKGQASLLRALLGKLGQNANKMAELFGEESKGRKVASEALNEIENLLVVSKKYSSNLEAKNDELVNKLSEYQSVMEKLHKQLYIIEQNSDSVKNVILNQVENLQNEVEERSATLVNELNSTFTMISYALEKLDTSTGRHLTVTDSTDPFDTLNVASRVAVSVDASCKMLDDFSKKLEAAYTEQQATRKLYEGLNDKFLELYVSNEMAVRILQTVYVDLIKMASDSHQDEVREAVGVPHDTLPDLLQPSNFENLIQGLGKLLLERMQLISAKNELELANNELVAAKNEIESAKNELESANNELVSAKNEIELANNELVSANNELHAELANKTRDIEEWNEKGLDPQAILKMVEDVEAVILEQVKETDLDVSPVSRLESLVAFLVQKYSTASEQVSLTRDEFESKVMELNELQSKMHQLSSLNLEYANQIHILKENLEKMDEDLKAARAEIQTKGAELEQSEHRVSSIREKLSIAVAKGKGLIVQRDNLKQSLSDMSTELERCSMELELKDSRLYEVEAKLKSYSEAGERIEALESELSYIRNSATALRESFLVKDSALQRMEEILEDLDLPEHFHSRDIVEKIEWLARSVAGNSLPVTDWDQKSSVGGSYSDAGFVVMDSWKEDVQSTSNSGLEELKRNYEELQSKFYGLAEQNEMLEQSLMERNNLVQRWEEVLDKIEMPIQLRSMEPEDRIEWLGTALSDAHHDRDSLRQKIENFEAYCGSLTGDLEESQRKVSTLNDALLGVTREKELLSVNLESLTHKHEEVSKRATQYELDKDNLLNELAELRKNLVDRVDNEENNHKIKDEMNKFQVLISEALQNDGTEDEALGSSNTERLEGSLRKLIENYMALSPKKQMLNDTEEEHVKDRAVFNERLFEDELRSKEKDMMLLKEELEEALVNLAHVKEERDTILEKHLSLGRELEALAKTNDDLQGRINQEEQKFIASREKLNVAVRKGKGLVQQRDNMKQNIEELNAEVERLKAELSKRENALVQYEQRIRDLSTYPEKVEAFESENSFLKNCLAETEHNLSDCRQTSSRLLDVVNAIDVGDGLNYTDPVKKMESVGKLCYDLQAAVGSSEQEAKKSKRAAELLVAELNEVQERADNLQEELSKVEAAFEDVSRERDVVDAARIEALSRIEKFITVRSEERKNELAEIMKLKAGVDQFRKGCFGFNDLLANFFSMDLELLRNVEAGMQVFLKQKDGSNVVQHLYSAPGGMGMLFSQSVNEVKFPTIGTLDENFDESFMIEMFATVGHGLEECIREVGDLREKLYKHSISSDQQAKSLFKSMEAVHREIVSQRDSFGSMRRDLSHLEKNSKEKDNDIIAMRKNFMLLYDACNSSVLEIENRKSLIHGSDMPSRVNVLGKTGADLKLPISINGRESIDRNSPFTEECVRTTVETLISAVKDLASIQLETVESGQKELKATIMSLQKELQEKDVQGNQICSELVCQIKDAEAVAKNYKVDLESTRTQCSNLEKQIESVEKERNELELRVKELQNRETISEELHERIRSLSETLTAKDQEIEALMQALDEEESQMEDLRSRINELEQVLQQKSIALENLEVSRGKVMAKLSTTVGRFDELHNLSEGLVAEVENLQSQLQSRDSEISFLRQEVTRCTNDALVASQESNQRHELYTWLNMMALRLGVQANLDENEFGQIQGCKEVVEKQITSVMSELEDLRVIGQSRDAMLEVERNRVEELQQRRETLESSLREKESLLASFQGSRGPGETMSMSSSEIVEVEPTMNKRAVAGSSIVPQVRSLRKGNNDQVSIAIDMDHDANTLVDEDDDKVHGFKSLTTSRIVPRFTRPLSDMVDGLWVSCDRALMRQPGLRLGIIIYWVIMHSLLAASIV